MNFIKRHSITNTLSHDGNKRNMYEINTNLLLRELRTFWITVPVTYYSIFY